MLEIKEEWRDVLGWEGLYQVSNLGRLKTLYREVTFLNQGKNFAVKKLRERMLKFSPNTKKRYHQALLRYADRKEQYQLHRLVAQAFCENPLNKPYVNHINGQKLDNRAENLEWCTNSENVRHSLSMGLSSNEHLKKFHIKKGNRPHNCKPVINLETGIFYDSIQTASETISVSPATLQNWLKGLYPNKSPFIYA